MADSDRMQRQPAAQRPTRHRLTQPRRIEQRTATNERDSIDCHHSTLMAGVAPVGSLPSDSNAALLRMSALSSLSSVHRVDLHCHRYHRGGDQTHAENDESNTGAAGRCRIGRSVADCTSEEQWHREDARSNDDDEPRLVRSGPSTPSPNATATTTTASSSIVEDIDRDDRHSTHCHVEYVDDVFRNLRAGERRLQRLKRALPETVERQRRQIVDWMCQVRTQLCLRPDTLALGVALLDRYAYLLVEQRDAAVLRISFGAGALMLASTLEEQFPPESRDFSFQCRCFDGDSSVRQRDLRRTVTPRIVAYGECARF